MSAENLFDLPDTIRTLRDQGALLHDLPPGVKNEVAAYGLYTTEEPRDPGTLFTFMRHLGRERAMKQIAGNATDVLRDIPGFAPAIEAGTLGTFLADVFGSVTAVHAHNVHLTDTFIKDGQLDGTVVAERMAFTVPDQERAMLLSGALQALLSTQDKVLHPVYTENEQVPIVWVSNLDEHCVRSLSRALQAVMDRQYASEGVRLPEEKLSLQRWKSRGETFAPFTEYKLSAANLAYYAIAKSGDFDKPDILPMHQHDLIGTDPAGMLQAQRDILNQYIDTLRFNNPEQHPRHEARPRIERSIMLRRDLIDPKATLQRYGPPSSRGRTISEWAADKAKEAVGDARDNKWRATAEIIGATGAIVVGGLVDAAAAVFRYGPTIFGLTKQAARDTQAWRHQKALAIEAGFKLDALAADLYCQAILQEPQPPASDIIPPYPTRSKS